MRRDWTLSTCFEHFGAARSRRHFGGSAISSDGTIVVVAMWEDEILRLDDGRIIYQSRFGPTLRGKSQRINLQWIAHLKWALAHCHGLIRVVVLTAQDPQANPRIVKSCHPDDTLVMQIIRLDTKTGVFEAHMM
jgi:hypothetical protein